MKRIAALLLWFTIVCHAQNDGGGRDVRIALFSAQPLQKLTVAAAGPGAWWAPCATCRHQPLITPLHMPGIQEIVAGGPVTVQNDEHLQKKTANGRWHLHSANHGTIDVVLTLPSERYVAAVLMGETDSSEPTASLQAMAVVARTFVLRTSSHKNTPGHLPSDICDSTACQAIKLGPVSAAVNEAVRSTAGETLWFGSQRSRVFFSGSCGGVTESAGAVWPKLSSLPYLRSIADPYCVRKDHATWHAEIPLTSFQEIAAREGWHLPLAVVSAHVTARTWSERAKTIAFISNNQQQSVVAASALRLAIGRSMGWNLVRSDLYDLRVRDSMLVFDGRGHGHGVGLCQQGAKEMARMGKSYREILGLYFAGTKVRITPSDDGWHQTTQNGISLTSTAIPPQAVMALAAESWLFAKSHYTTPHIIIPSITVAPSTELFRQLTLQQGWQLASTSGSTIILQPFSVIAGNRVSLKKTLEHEMLHVAVESSANPKAPLWLREGLVEVLAEEEIHTSPTLSPQDTERLLQNAASQQESQAAHAAAAARTRQLVDRYGISAVRGWLVAGSSIPIE
ncbi:SpoIID/LytB domain-containing protein [Terriglobus sp. TAA 43]|uniref:SpoIID/LytB domain-containing protein n=1 Tax=Terriglobus sp. TAA 43 TaxID=278961 RepID=UPI000645E19C|nr:SpoIID/LytB domain-containing protein [Terriglobus sp. TAA 43]